MIARRALVLFAITASALHPSVPQAARDEKLSWEEADALNAQDLEDAYARYRPVHQKLVALQAEGLNSTPQVAELFRRLWLHTSRIVGIMVRRKEFAEIAVTQGAFSTQKGQLLRMYQQAWANYDLDFIRPFFKRARDYAAALHEKNRVRERLIKNTLEKMQEDAVREVKRVEGLKELLRRLEVPAEKLDFRSLEAMGLKDWPTFRASELGLQRLIAVRDEAVRIQKDFERRETHSFVRWVQEITRATARARARHLEAVHVANGAIEAALQSQRESVTKALNTNGPFSLSDLAFYTSPDPPSTRALHAFREAEWKAFCDGAGIPYTTDLEERLRMIDAYQAAPMPVDPKSCADDLQ